VGRDTSLDLVVGGEHRSDVTHVDRLFKRAEEDVTEGSLGKLAGPNVGAVFGLAVNEVLGGGDDVFVVGRSSLQTRDGRHAHGRNEIGVLRVHLLVATVAWFAAQVEDWRKHQRVADGARLLRDNAEHLLDQFGVSRASQTDDLREGRGAAEHSAVQCFAVKENGNTEARVRHHPLLQEVALFGGVQWGSRLAGEVTHERVGADAGAEDSLWLRFIDGRSLKDSGRFDERWKTGCPSSWATFSPQESCVQGDRPHGAQWKRSRHGRAGVIAPRPTSCLA